MYDPWQKFRLQPWKSLFQVAFFTIVIASFIDLAFNLLLINSDLWYRLLASQILIISLVYNFGLGVLGVYIAERWKPEVKLNTSSLWALILCLIICIFLRTLIPIRALLISFSKYSIIPLIVGLFWKGRFYWRYWR